MTGKREGLVVSVICVELGLITLEFSWEEAMQLAELLTPFLLEAGFIRLVQEVG